MILDLICQQFPEIPREEIIASLRAIDATKVVLHPLSRRVPA